jgi:hypothetical protein
MADPLLASPLSKRSSRSDTDAKGTSRVGCGVNARIYEGTALNQIKGAETGYMRNRRPSSPDKACVLEDKSRAWRRGVLSGRSGG